MSVPPWSVVPLHGCLGVDPKTLCRTLFSFESLKEHARHAHANTSFASVLHRFPCISLLSSPLRSVPSTTASDPAVSAEAVGACHFSPAFSSPRLSHGWKHVPKLRMPGEVHFATINHHKSVSVCPALVKGRSSTGRRGPPATKAGASDDFMTCTA